MRQLFQIQKISAKSACAETPWGTPWASASGSANLLGLLFTHPVYIQRPKDTRRICCADMLLHSCPNVAKKLKTAMTCHLSWSEFWPAKHHKTLQTNQTAKQYWNHMKSSSNLQYSSHLAPRIITSAGALKLRPGAERPGFKVPESPMDPARWRTSLAEYTGSCYHSELLREKWSLSAIHSSTISYFNVSASGGVAHFLDEDFPEIVTVPAPNMQWTAAFYTNFQISIASRLTALLSLDSSICS